MSTVVDLQDMLDAQLALQQHMPPLGRDVRHLDEEARAEFIRWNAYALEDEIHEATAEVGWKPWQTSRHLNREAYLKEMVDAFHFFMNLLLVARISAEELAEGYYAKREVNIKRQSDGYDGLSKCRSCKRSFDDVSVVEFSRMHDRVAVPFKRCVGCGYEWEVVCTTP